MRTWEDGGEMKKRSEREEFAKEILDMLDEIVRNNPDLENFISPIKNSIRELRDKIKPSKKKK